jgi:hypothetical protein
MIQVSVKSLADVTAEQLAAFKAYLASNGAETDAQLTAILRSAMIAVQEWEDRSLLDETIVLIHAHRADPRAPIRLYRSVDTITSVKDADGNALPYTRIGNLLTVGVPARNVEIEYKTKATAEIYASLESKVFRLAAAKYDGEMPNMINKILMEG